MPEKLSACVLCSSSSLLGFDASIALCKCEDCGLIFRNPRPSMEEITAYYSRDAQYDTWLAEETARDVMWRKRLKKIATHRSNGTLLDVGTGIGQFLNVAQVTFTVEGTEISASALKIAADKFGLALHHGSLEEVAYTALRGRRFDIVTLFHVLEHFPYPDATLDTCARIIADGGLLVVAVPNDIWCWKSLLKDLLRSLGIRRFSSCGRFGLRALDLKRAWQRGSSVTLYLFCTGSGTSAPWVSNPRARAGSLLRGCGAAAAVHTLKYEVCSMLRRMTKINIYDALWLVAEKHRI